MNTSDFDYDLPPELIAQAPLPERTQSRMLVLDRADGSLAHRHIRDVGEYLRAGDVLVLNDTKVFPARVFGAWRDTGGNVELLLLEDVGEGVWDALCRSRRRPAAGLVMELAGGELTGCVLEGTGGTGIRVRLTCERPLMTILATHGVPPVPPYIKRGKGVTDAVALDRDRYQTVYARETGAVAAPTAGLHFDEQLLAVLRARGIRQAMVTLHVGIGTFLPVKVENVEDHQMASERFAIGPRAAEEIRSAREGSGRVVAVGTTTVRTLETVAGSAGEIEAGDGRTELFIRPPYTFRAVDALLTNFHLPRSTLLMMISALAGRELVLRAYREAVRERYRFYSYGDCMLIV